MAIGRLIFLVAIALFSRSAVAEEPLASCKPTVSDERVLDSVQDRQSAGQRAIPPLTDRGVGFAWPDTPMGVVKTDSGYHFFASDGASHSDGVNVRGGTATRTTGTLDNPLGETAPLNSVIRQNPDPSVNAEFSKYQYLGGGPVYRVPSGQLGAGKLLMVTHAEFRTPDTKPTPSFYSVLGLASSSDDGASWTDLGEIVRVNHPYAPDMDGFEIGDPPLVTTKDHQFFMIYFRDWQGNEPHKAKSVTTVPVARAPISAVLQAAFGDRRSHAASFTKYFDGKWEEPGIGGRSSDINPNGWPSDEVQVAHNSDLDRYVMIMGAGTVVSYAESIDGINWSRSTVIRDFRGQNHRIYVMPVGMGPDPTVLGRIFYVMYTWIPTSGGGWPSAELRRFTVACQ